MSILFNVSGPAPVDGRKIMLATTVYDSPDASYTFAIATTREAMHNAGLPTAYFLLAGNCHVDDARNSIVGHFLRSDCSELVFLDADVSWRPEQLIELCGYDADLVGGVYPYRRDGVLNRMPVRNIKGVFEADENGLLEVEGLPTGFMRIRRKVLEILAEDAVWFNNQKGERCPKLFERVIFGDSHMGGDIHFCRKWRERGGKVHAAWNLWLGHCGKGIVRDSLAAVTRRQMNTTLRHVCDEIKAGRDSADLIAEAEKWYRNPYGVPRDVLGCAIAMARKVQGPIIEAGSGLSTILMAAASAHPVYAIEHDPVFATQLQQMALLGGVQDNVYLITAPIQNDWYFLGKDMAELPARFAAGFVDGPPWFLGDRMKFFDVFGDRCTAFLVDDVDDDAYADKVRAWAKSRGKVVEHPLGRIAAILPADHRKTEAA